MTMIPSPVANHHRSHAANDWFWYLSRIVLLFAIHRLFNFPFLTDWAEPVFQQTFRNAIIGLASDFWSATLVSSAIVLMVTIGSKGFIWIFGQHQQHHVESLKRYLPQFIIIALGIALSCHQVYVEYFRSPLQAFHLTYASDGGFLQASWTSIISLPTFALTTFALWFAFLPSPQKCRLTHTVVCIIGALAVHALQLRYREQWHVPHGLRHNVLEHLYIDWTQSEPIPPLSEEEKVSLAGFLGSVPTLTPSGSTAWHPAFDRLRQLLHESQTKGNAPIILVALLESTRMDDLWPDENGLVQNPSTPTLMGLSRKGVVFPRTYSTGIVTRGAQEALWCGYPGQQFNSMMRQRRDIQIDCLPRQLEKSGRGMGHWFHGGEARFDSQASFWVSQGVKDLLSRKDFAENIPATPWGASDLALSREILNRLPKLPKSPLHLIMMLTITNHMPWVLPDDAPDTLRNRSWDHPSHGTLAYQDLALGQLTEGLRRSATWPRTLLLLVGDHGHLAPIMPGSPSHDRVTDEEKLSHVPWIISGGIGETLAHEFLQDKEFQSILRQPISQTDIGRFLADLIDIPLMTVGENPFLPPQERRLPVVSHLGNRVYFPSAGQSVPRQALTGKINTFDHSIRLGLLTYKALTQAYQQTSGRHGASTRTP